MRSPENLLALQALGDGLLSLAIGLIDGADEAVEKNGNRDLSNQDGQIGSLITVALSNHAMHSP